MKRFRIWVKNLTLLQQFLSISFVVIVFFLIFFFAFLPKSIDTFVNQQMYSYLHNSQDDYINKKLYSLEYNNISDDNVVHFTYSIRNNLYLETIDITSNNGKILTKINPIIETEVYDGNFYTNGRNVVYSIRKINDDYNLVSIIKNDYRSAFRTALVDSTINTTLFMIIGLYTFLMMWVISLIHPLNTIRNYIEKIKKGDKTNLNIDRKDEIGEVAEALVDMNEELAKQTKIREEMIQNISHDLKTPIATIKSYSESIKDGIYPYDTLEKSVDVIIEHADRLEKKVYSLIQFNKLGYLEDDMPEGDNVDMRIVIQTAILASNVLRGDIKIETNLEEVYFHGNEENWRIVIENLVDNAIRYAKSIIIITLNEEGLSVYNDGELLEKDRIDKLFKPYEKGNKGRFGLGLSIVKRVTETYGYYVCGENMDDGVIFRIEKPNKRKTKKQSVK